MNLIKINYQNITTKYPVIIVLFAGLYSLVIISVLFFLFEEAEIINNSNIIRATRHTTIEQVLMALLIAIFMKSILFYTFYKYVPNGLASFKTVSIIILVCSCIITFALFETINEALAIDLLQIVFVGIILYSIDKNFETEDY